MAKFGVGQPVRRVEDQRFITGAGRYTDDIDLDGQAYIAVVRSPEAHARIKSIEVDAARAAPGVLAVVTGAEYAATGGNALPCGIPMENRDGSKGQNRLRPVLCIDRVRHVGDNVAFVVAETPSQAKDAAELVAVDYESLPAVADTETAAEPGQPLVHDDVPNNLSFDWEYGDRAAVDAAFAKAAHITRLRVINNRLVANAIEPRAAIAEYDAAAGTVTLHTCTQGGWLFTDILAGALKIDGSKVRILTPDVGGGFGMKAFFYPEYAMAAWASRLLGRPVKWTGERAETFLADVMGRDHVTEAELALDADHRILGMRVETTANMGAYSSLFGPFIPTAAALKVLPGVYDVKHLVYRVKGVLTNTTPVDAYRGAGPAGIDLSDGAADRCRRARGRRGPGRVPAQELHSVVGDAVQDRGRRGLRFRRVRSGDGRRAEGSRLERLCPAQIGRRSARPAARHRPVVLHRIDHGRPAGGGQDQLRGGRHGQRRGRHSVERPGARDRLRAAGQRPPRRAVREDPHRPGRYRQAQVGRRHRRLTLAHRGGHGDPRRLGPGDRAGQNVRRPGVRGGGRRHRLRALRRHVPGQGHGPRDRHP